MIKNNFPFNNVLNTKKLFANLGVAKKSCGALIFWVLKEFFVLEQFKSKSKILNLAYKALKKFSVKAVQLLRFYGRDAFKTEFKKWLTFSASLKSRKQINVRVDASKTGHKYGFLIPELKILYDYVSNSNIKTHEIYVLLVSIGNKDYIADFVLKKKDEKGGNRIAKSMIYNLYNSMDKLKPDFRKYVRISLDGAFGNGDMISWLNKHKLTNTAIKSGGKDYCRYVLKDKEFRNTLKNLEQHLLKEGCFKEFNPCHHLSGEYVDILVEINEVTLKAVLVRYKRKKKNSYRSVLVLSHNLDWHSFQIIQTYKGRWQIEVMFRTSKQHLGLEKYSFHSEDNVDNIEMHLALRFICYMWLSWYRAEHTRPSKTSLKDVILRWRRYLNELPPKSFQQLFSG